MVHSMLQFIKKSPDCFHAVDTLEQILRQEGYFRLEPGAWNVEPGGKYYAVRNGSSLIAFRIPQATAVGFRLTASHSDSPCFRIRDWVQKGKHYTGLLCERYGGMLNATWMDRPLSVSGRVVVRNGSRIETRLVNLEQDCVLIPNVAIHLNREANTELKLDPARDLQPLFGGADAGASFSSQLAEKAGCRTEDLLSTELFVYNNQPGSVWGPEGEFVSAPRLDDLACVYACLQGFLMAQETDTVPVFGVFDNEEIGSETKQGAASDFLHETLETICRECQGDLSAMLANSFLLSCDNGHALHPNRPELADGKQAPVLGGGVVIKHSPRYATDGMSSAVVQEVCRRAAIPVQHYANRPDQAGGSTLGNIANTKVSVLTADIGMAQLAMHSCYETAGSRDVEYMIRCVKACCEMPFRVESAAVVFEE